MEVYLWPGQRASVATRQIEVYRWAGQRAGWAAGVPQARWRFTPGQPAGAAHAKQRLSLGSGGLPHAKQRFILGTPPMPISALSFNISAPGGFACPTDTSAWVPQIHRRHSHQSRLPMRRSQNPKGVPLNLASGDFPPASISPHRGLCKPGRHSRLGSPDL